MSSKQTTDTKSNTAFQFDPSSMQAYQGNLATVMPFLRQQVNNPFGSDAFNQEKTISQDQARRVGQRNMSNVIQNAGALGYSTRSGIVNSMLNRATMNTNALQAQGFRGAIGNAVNRQMQSAGMLESYQPLLTGSNSNSQQVQQTSGLGTWLPQLAGAAIGAGASALTGGASSAAKGLGSFSNISQPSSIFGAPSGFPGMNGVIGAFPGMNSGGMPSFYGTGYGYKG